MEEIIISQVGELRQMEAPEGYWLTQNDDVGENRVYVRKRIMLSDGDRAVWRLAGGEEKEAWESQMAEKIFEVDG